MFGHWFAPHASYFIEHLFYAMRAQHGGIAGLDQELISVRALVFDLAQLTCQKRFDCRNAIIRSSETFLNTS